MGYAIVTSACIGCGAVFGYNPHKVPSTTAITGTREPICQTCFARINEQRKANGLEPFVALPGAYDGIEEHEL